MWVARVRRADRFGSPTDVAHDANAARRRARARWTGGRVHPCLARARVVCCSLVALRRWLSPALPLSHASVQKTQCFERAEDRPARSRLQASACTGNVRRASRGRSIHDEHATMTPRRVTITLRVVVVTILATAPCALGSNRHAHIVSIARDRSCNDGRLTEWSAEEPAAPRGSRAHWSARS